MFAGYLQHVGLAKMFEQLVLDDTRFEVTNDVILGLVCFRIKVRRVTNYKERNSRSNDVR